MFLGRGELRQAQRDEPQLQVDQRVVAILPGPADGDGFQLRQRRRVSNGLQ